jgi:predicted nuclease with TOPRIM domain
LGLLGENRLLARERNYLKESVKYTIFNLTNVEKFGIIILVRKLSSFINLKLETLEMSIEGKEIEARVDAKIEALVKEWEKEKQDYKDKIKTLKAENQVYGGRIETLERDYNNYEGRIETLESDNHSLECLVDDEIQGKLETANNQIRMMAKELTKMTGKTFDTFPILDREGRKGIIETVNNIRATLDNQGLWYRNQDTMRDDIRHQLNIIFDHLGGLNKEIPEDLKH